MALSALQCRMNSMKLASSRELAEPDSARGDLLKGWCCKNQRDISRLILNFCSPTLIVLVVQLINATRQRRQSGLKTGGVMSPKG